MKRIFENPYPTEAERKMFGELGLYRVPSRKPDTLTYVPVPVEQMVGKFPVRVETEGSLIRWDRQIVIEIPSGRVKMGPDWRGKRTLALVMERLEELESLAVPA